MFGWIMLAAAVVGMARIAAFENMSGLLWGSITFVLCIACVVLMPDLPMVNIAIGAVASFIALTGYKMFAQQ